MPRTPVDWGDETLDKGAFLSPQPKDGLEIWPHFALWKIRPRLYRSPDFSRLTPWRILTR